MKELEELLNEIDKTCEEKLNENIKKQILTNLWNLYKAKKEKYSSDMDNQIYIIDQESTNEKVDLNSVKRAIVNLKKSDKKGISMEDAITLLKWDVQNTRENLCKLGIDINTHSLDGYCELAQLLSIYPLEQLGLKVTKNTAKDSFNYLYNHAFGSVRFLINENEKIVEKYFLIDVTYKQFFIKEKCSKIQYYLGDMVAPTIGHFVKDNEFARNIIKDGFIELTESSARKYGEPFTQSSLSNEKIDYFYSIINSNNDYILSESQLEGLNVNLP